MTIVDNSHTDGKLADLAPTILSILNVAQPKEMTGVNLVKA